MEVDSAARKKDIILHVEILWKMKKEREKAAKCSRGWFLIIQTTAHKNSG